MGKSNAPLLAQKTREKWGTRHPAGAGAMGMEQLSQLRIRRGWSREDQSVAEGSDENSQASFVTR